MRATVAIVTTDKDILSRTRIASDRNAVIKDKRAIGRVCEGYERHRCHNC